MRSVIISVGDSIVERRDERVFVCRLAAHSTGNHTRSRESRTSTHTQRMHPPTTANTNAAGTGPRRCRLDDAINSQTVALARDTVFRSLSAAPSLCCADLAGNGYCAEFIKRGAKRTNKLPRNWIQWVPSPLVRCLRPLSVVVVVVVVVAIARVMFSLLPDLGWGRTGFVFFSERKLVVGCVRMEITRPDHDTVGMFSNSERETFYIKFCADGNLTLFGFCVLFLIGGCFVIANRLLQKDTKRRRS